MRIRWLIFASSLCWRDEQNAILGEEKMKIYGGFFCFCGNLCFMKESGWRIGGAISTTLRTC